MEAITWLNRCLLKQVTVAKHYLIILKLKFEQICFKNRFILKRRENNYNIDYLVIFQ